jgi:hypothetical protein
LRGLGESRRLSLARIDKMLERLQGYREIFVVIETDGPSAVAKAIRMASSEGGDARVSRARHIEYPLRAEDEEQE